jgi:hypothetical protein
MSSPTPRKVVTFPCPKCRCVRGFDRKVVAGRTIYTCGGCGETVESKDVSSNPYDTGGST